MKLEERKYKEKLPKETVNEIQNILNELDILTIETWSNSLNDFYSLNLEIAGTNIATNGKGTTYEYALASANAEFMERLQNQLLYHRRISKDKELMNYQGFYYAPDEKYVSKEKILNKDSEWLNLLISDNLTEEQKEHLIELVSSFTPTDYEADFIEVPYYDVNNDQQQYIPFNMLTDYYGSNGMCAGNTPEEALVQGISEVLERHANKRIIKDRITPPTIPDKYLKKFPQIYSMIEQIEQVGNYKVIMKDCSLNEGFPVVAAIIINLDTQEYFVKFGAHPVIEIALERPLTEFLQGREIEGVDRVLGMMEFSYFNDKVQTFENIENIFVHGSGYYPTELFDQEFDYSFTGFEKIKANGEGNENLLQNLVNLLQDKDYNILVRDVSFLGFPSFHVIIPGMSEIFPTDERSTELMEKRVKLLVEAKEIINHQFPEVSTEELKTIINVMKEQNYDNTDSLADIISRRMDDSFPWTNIRTDIFIAAAYYKMEKFEKAYEALDSFINDIDEDEFGTRGATYYKCIRDYIGARLDGLDTKEIKQTLGTIYKLDIIDKVIADMKDPEEVLQSYGSLNCWDCAECMFRRHCFYEDIRELHKKVKKAYAENPIPQKRNREIFKK